MTESKDLYSKKLFIGMDKQHQGTTLLLQIPYYKFRL